MKRLFFAAVFGIATFASFANPVSTNTKISYKAKESFQQQFGEVKNVQWSNAKNDLLKADFDLEGQLVTAFFTSEGDLVATTIAMEKSQLPLRLRLALERELNGQSIDELFYVEHPSEAAYYISSEKAGAKKIYRAYQNGSIKEVSKSILH